MQPETGKKRKKMKKVLLVCTGNTCRSAMAAAWLRHLCDRDGVNGVAVCSAGLDACPGEGASRFACETIRAAGGDLSGHTAQRLTPELAEQADVIAVMTRSQLLRVRALAPGTAAETCLLMHWSHLNYDGDVPDPFGGTPADYRRCFTTMQEALENLYHTIINHVKPT